jgi:hypothetical protein
LWSLLSDYPVNQFLIIGQQVGRYETRNQDPPRLILCKDVPEYRQRAINLAD